MTTQRRRRPQNWNEQHHERGCLCEETPCPCNCHMLDGSEAGSSHPLPTSPKDDRP